jgi:hypothetical protein
MSPKEKELFEKVLESKDIYKKIKRKFERKDKITHEDLKVLLLYGAAGVTGEVLKRYGEIGLRLNRLELRIPYYFGTFLLGIIVILSFFATFHWTEFAALFIFVIVSSIAAMILLDIEFRKRIRKLELEYAK